MMPARLVLPLLSAPLLALSLAACSDPAPVAEQPPAEPAAQAQAPAAPPMFAVVYRCADGTSFTTFPRGDSVQLDFANRTLKLHQVPAASGTKYSDGQTTVWSKGETATLQQNDTATDECQGTEVSSVWEAARLRGVTMRAVGNEPAWLLEVTPGQELVFAWDYGAQRISGKAPDATRDDTKKTSTWLAKTSSGQLRAEITDGTCSDGMSEESYPASATVTFNGKVWKGCARTL
ncbi:MAG: MliC family protein [Pseudomonadota bacterium]